MFDPPPPFSPSNDFLRSFDTRPFLFRHNLSQNELFTFPALYGLAKKAANSENRRARKVMVRQPTTPGFLIVNGRSLRWGSPEFHQALGKAFEQFETSNVRLKLTAVHEYDGYRELLAECTRNLSELTGVDFSRHYDRGIATFFISSPHETTPYHIDQEVNFLLQIHGCKQVYLFDGEDRDIVSQKDLEEFWFGRSFIQQIPGSSCQTFDIGPQQGVFNPPFFPHIVKTGPQPSVSLSLGFSRLHFPVAEVHRMNAYMRKLGCEPSSPGRNPGRDHLKSVVIRHAVSLKRSLMGC